MQLSRWVKMLMLYPALALLTATMTWPGADNVLG